MKDAAKSGEKKAKPSANGNFLIVGIGASAGGIKALKDFFANVPKDSGNAYVVILHLSPEYDSKLAEILQTTAPIPVKQVKDRRVRVKPDCVYVIPPNKSLAMRDGHLSTSAVTSYEERRAPVDIFFRTLAESHDSYAVSVILSGTGADGSMGVKRIKEKGGIIIVQDPNEAEYNDMPRHSIATGLVDYVLSVNDISAQINAYKNQLGKAQIQLDAEDSRDEADEKALREIFTQLRIRTGHDFSNYKRATVLRRIARRMNVRGLTDLPAYSHFMRTRDEETQALLKDLLISVTNFFRDGASFEMLESNVIPKILENKTPQDSARIWVAGCATGEEAYSMAVLFAEQTANNADAPTVQIFATDIDEPAIAHARLGLYTNSDVADVSPERLRLFFQKEGDNFRIRREIREMVMFAVHNVTKDPPFSRLDLVSCRNLLIYLNRSAQNRVMETVHFALNPGGYLFLGSSESADGAGDLFVPVSKENRIFQARPVAARLSLPVPNLSIALLGSKIRPTTEQYRVEEIRALERLSYTALHRQLLEQYAPPSVVINEDFDIVHISERAGRYMRISGGEPTTNLLHIARPELRLELRTALYNAMKKRTGVNVQDIQVSVENRIETVNIIVRPVLQEDDAKRGYILVIFEPTSDKEAALSASALPDDEPIARQLEEELVRTKSQLRATVEQYEVQTEELRASNEELQAINEELRSAAEEIETSKEELHSVNEELQTVNQELKIKIEELSASHNDLRNLMNSTDIGTIFLDRALRVKMFTEPIKQNFNLLPADLGRPLTDITGRFKYDGLIADIRQVLQTLQTIEREIITNDDRWYLMRVFPYRTGDDKIEGVVITFLEITERRRREDKSVRLARQLEQQSRIFNTTLSTVNDYIYNFDRDGRFLYANQILLGFFGLKADEVIGKTMAELDYPKDVETILLDSIRQVFDTGQTVINETTFTMPDGSRRYSENILSPFFAADGTVEFVVGASRDSSKRRKSEQDLRQSQERFRLLVESATDYAIFTVTEDNHIDSWNSGAERIFGWKEKEIIGKSGAVLFVAEDRERGVPAMEMRCALETGKAEDERWHVRKDGSRFYASGVMQPLQDNAGFVKICRDQTEKITAQSALQDKAMLKQLVSTQEDERRRIARDIHDHLGQQLTALRLKLEAVRKICEDGVICDGIEEAQEVAEQLDREVDFLAWELRPAALDDLGLRVTLTNFVREWSNYSDIKAGFHSVGLSKTRLPFEVETNLYRIAQEALNNIVKHASAKNVSVLLEKRGNMVTLIIEDDGDGFNPPDKTNRTKGIGLIGMVERAKICGGTLEIESAKGKGTTVFARVPAKV